MPMVNEQDKTRMMEMLPNQRYTARNESARLWPIGHYSFFVFYFFFLFHFCRKNSIVLQWNQSDFIIREFCATHCFNGTKFTNSPKKLPRHGIQKNTFFQPRKERSFCWIFFLPSQFHIQWNVKQTNTNFQRKSKQVMTLKYEYEFNCLAWSVLCFDYANGI